MPGVIEGGVAVLFAVVAYGAFFAAAGAQLHRALTADEGAGLRAFYAAAVVAVSAIAWVLVGAMVYGGTLLWFRFFLQQPQPWRQQILDRTRWFPAGVLVETGAFPPGAGRGLAVLLGYPAALFLAAALVALWRRLRRDRDDHVPAPGIVTTFESVEERR